MNRSLLVTLALAIAALAVPLLARGELGIGSGGGTPGTALNFTLVGHDPLFARGMNAAPAIYDHYLYVGSRTDGSPKHPRAGILIVDIANPAAPAVVGEIGPPDAGLPGITTRELRVWPQKKLLMVLTFGCSSGLHGCKEVNVPASTDFYDLSDPLHPRQILSHVTKSSAGATLHLHEFFLWVDPRDPERALLWKSTPNGSVNPADTNLVIEEISAVPGGGLVRLVAQGNWNQLFPDAARPERYDYDLYLHSMAPSFDGTRTYLAYLRGGFGILDTSKVARKEVTADTVELLNDDLITPAPFPNWGIGSRCGGRKAPGCAESHSAVPLPGRPFVLTTDEVYGRYASPAWGWPWGWARVWGVAEPRKPKLLGEYQIHQNTEAFAPSSGENQRTSYSSHNPTLTRNLALVSWHSGGLQAIDLTTPSAPVQAGWFSPAPLASVATEDPALSAGPNKVVVWSYPIVREGLIYVIDIRNGLYILRYTGPRAAEVADVSFLEGNSNLGDAGRLNETAM
jgi:hypothetical protein